MPNCLVSLVTGNNNSNRNTDVAEDNSVFCLHLEVDLVVLLLEILEFCARDGKTLAQISARNGVLICCSQLHFSARRLTSNGEAQHQKIQVLCKTILDRLRGHSNYTVQQLKTALEHDYTTSTKVHNSNVNAPSEVSEAPEYLALTLAMIVTANTMALVGHLKCYKNYFVHYDGILEKLYNLQQQQVRCGIGWSVW